VKVAFGSVVLLNVPVPPLTIDHSPVAGGSGVLPPSGCVVPNSGIVCGPPALAVGPTPVIVTVVDTQLELPSTVSHRA